MTDARLFRGSRFPAEVILSPGSLPKPPGRRPAKLRRADAE
jgi:hypothetical protein